MLADDQLLRARAVAQRGQRAADLVAGDVVAEEHPAQPVQRGRAGGVIARGVGGEVDALGGLLGGLVLDRLQLQQRRLRRDLHVGAGQHAAHAARERRHQRRLHLHRLDDRDDVALGHLVALADRDRHHDRRAVRAHEAAVVAGDAVRDAVDLDQQVGALAGDHRAVRDAVDRDPAFVPGQALDGGLDGVAVDVRAVAAGSELGDDDAVGLAAMADLDRARDLRGGLGAAAAREGVEARALERGLAVGELDRGLQQGDVGAALGLHLAAHAEAVEPLDVDRSRLELRAVEDRQDEGAVGRAVLDDHRALAQGALEAGGGLLAGAAVGDDLRHHRVEVGRDDVAGGDAAVDAHAGAGREVQHLDAAGRGREAHRGVLGVQARLDRVADGLGRLAFELAAGGDVQLQLDEVEAGDGLGDGVLDLQARVDLHEGEALLVGLVEELDRARVAVAGLEREAHGGGLDLLLLLAREHDAGGLLDDLLVPALAGAVAHARGPGGALAVGDQLHLDVVRVADHRLHEDRAVAERVRGLAATRRQRGFETVGVIHPPDPTAAAARGRLDHQRVADALGVLPRLLDRLDRAVGPRRDRHAGLLGHQLGLDLVAELAHHIAARADEDEAHLLDHVHERRVLGDEAPARPHGVGACRDQGPLEAVVIEVRAARGLAPRL